MFEDLGLKKSPIKLYDLREAELGAFKAKLSYKIVKKKEIANRLGFIISEDLWLYTKTEYLSWRLHI